MPFCTQCGRPIKEGADPICKFCQMDNEELGNISVGESFTSDQPKVTSRFLDQCPTCNGLIGADRTCHSCDSIQLECECGAINYFTTDRIMVVLTENQPLKKQFTCSQCGLENYRCPYCNGFLKEIVSHCPSCNLIIFYNYFYHLKDRGLCANFYDDYERYSELVDEDPVNKHRIMEIIPDWGWLYADEEIFQFEQILENLNNSLAVNEIIDYEGGMIVKPFTVLINSLNSISCEIQNADKVSKRASQFSTENPSARNLLINTVSSGKLRTSLTKSLDQIEQLVLMEVGAHRSRESIIHDIFTRFTGRFLWGMREMLTLDECMKNIVGDAFVQRLNKIAEYHYLNPDIPESREALAEYNKAF